MTVEPTVWRARVTDNDDADAFKAHRHTASGEAASCNPHCYLGRDHGRTLNWAGDTGTPDEQSRRQPCLPEPTGRATT